MSRVSGIFDTIDNLDLISSDEVTKWLKRPPQPIALQNYIANRLLYPQAVAASMEDLEIDLAILREALKKDQSYFSPETRKIIIPDLLVSRIPDLAKLVWVFIDAYLLNLDQKTRPEIWTVVLRGDGTDETLGTIIAPHFKGRGSITIDLDGKSSTLKQGGLMIIPCPKNQCEIKFKVSEGEILTQKSGVVEVFGGKLGLVIEGRTP